MDVDLEPGVHWTCDKCYCRCHKVVCICGRTLIEFRTKLLENKN